MDIREAPAIDVHCHYGAYVGRTPSLMDRLCKGDTTSILRQLELANVRCAIVSSLKALLPRGAGAVLPGNEDVERICTDTGKLFQWAVLNPLEHETYKQAEILLKHKKCLGIKIHPEEHVYPIKEYGKAIFSFAAKHNAIVQAHSGEENSEPMDYIIFTNEYPELRLILSHIGCGWDGDMTKQVRAIQASKHGNVYSDTSSAKSITPGLIEWAVKEAGSEKIMFGTDAPCYYAPMQRARIDSAELENDDKQNILYRTSLRLFGGELEKIYNNQHF